MDKKSKNNNHEKEVQAAVENFSRAFLEADVETLGKALTMDYVHLNGNSSTVFNRDEWLSWVKTRRKELENKELEINDYRVEDVIIKTYENVAIVTGTVYSSGERNGEAFVSHVRFTNTWILVDGTWHRAAFHDSPLPNSES